MVKRTYLLGHIVVDTIVHGNTVRRSLGGTVVYGALASLRHGFVPHIVSKVGPDFPDEFLVFLSRNGIDISGVRISPCKTTRFKLVYKDSDRLLYVPSRCSNIEPEDVLSAKMDDSVAIVGPVIGEVPLDTLKATSGRAAITAIDLQGFIRRVDKDSRVRFERTPQAIESLKYADIVHAEIFEAKIILGDKDPPSLASELVDLGAGISLVTLGEEGAYVATKRRILYIPAAEPRRVVDSTGSGDVFTSVFTLEYYKTSDIVHAATMAAAAASYLVERPGIEGLQDRWKVKRRAEKIVGGVEVIEEK